MLLIKVYLNKVGYYECWFVVRVCVNDFGEFIVEGYVELEI